MHYIDRVIDSMIDGQIKQAVAIVSEGCKTKPYVMAARALRCYKELQACGHDGLAGRLYNAILYKGDSL